MLYPNFQSVMVVVKVISGQSQDFKCIFVVFRTSTIPEELGRVNYLLSDKTGTLTQNEMVFKRLHLGSVSFGLESTREVELNF